MRTAICLSLTLIITASASLADNRSRTQGFVLPDGTIEAVPNFSEDQLYWCGAYEAARLIASGTDRLYVIQGPGPSQSVPGRAGVIFSLTPPPGAQQAQFTNSVEIIGNNLSVAQAGQTCNERNASG